MLDRNVHENVVASLKEGLSVDPSFGRYSSLRQCKNRISRLFLTMARFCSELHIWLGQHNIATQKNQNKDNHPTIRCRLVVELSNTYGGLCCINWFWSRNHHLCVKYGHVDFFEIPNVKISRKVSGGEMPIGQRRGAESAAFERSTLFRFYQDLITSGGGEGTRHWGEKRAKRE